MSSVSFSSFVSKLGHKLQVPATTIESGQIIAKVAQAVGDDFESFRSYCASEALYIIAICQTESQARKAEWEAEQEALAEASRHDIAALNEFTEKVVETIPAKG